MLLSPSYRSAPGCHRNGILAGWEMLKQSAHTMSFYHARSCPTLDTCVALLSWQLYLKSAVANIVAPLSVWIAASLDQCTILLWRWAGLPLYSAQYLQVHSNLRLLYICLLTFNMLPYVPFCIWLQVVCNEKMCWRSLIFIINLLLSLLIVEMASCYNDTVVQQVVVLSHSSRERSII